MTQTERLEHINYLKRSLERWDEEPMSDQALRLTLRWIKVLEDGVEDYDFWGDYPQDLEKDTKNWRICECKEGWEYCGCGKHVFKKHRHRIYRTLEQAIKDLNE